MEILRRSKERLRFYGFDSIPNIPSFRKGIAVGLPIPVERIQQSIILIRGKKVMLDADLAQLYGVSTKRLNEQVRRNRDRFPEDFMFQLNAAEVKNLRSHFAPSKKERGGRRYSPYVLRSMGRSCWPPF